MAKATARHILVSSENIFTRFVPGAYRRAWPTAIPWNPASLRHRVD